MISRRLLRIKVLQVFYAHLFSNPRFDIELAHKNLEKSIFEYYRLYFLLTDLLLEIKKAAEQKIEIEKSKFFSDETTRKPFEQIAGNRILRKIENSKNFKQIKTKYKINWSEHPGFLKKMFSDFQTTKVFQILTRDISDFSDDKKAIIKTLSDFIHIYSPMYAELEEMSIFWNDDIEFALSMVEKTIKGITESSEDIIFFPLYKNDDDKHFAVNLLEKTILEQDERKKQMIPFLRNWDLQRIFVLDIYTIQLAITEFIHFPTVPVKVTINEYIDISKAYGTVKSWAFINGILDKIAVDFKEKNIIQKKGRGLVEK